MREWMLAVEFLSQNPRDIKLIDNFVNMDLRLPVSFYKRSRAYRNLLRQNQRDTDVTSQEESIR